MADFIKSKIIARLARFTKDLKPQDINLSFFSGKGELNNLELDPNFLNEVLQLPPWIEFHSATCDNIRTKIHLTRLQSEPIQIYINELTVKVTMCEDKGPRSKQELSSGGPTKYGFTEKVIDGMRVEIKLITVQFLNPIFNLHLSIHDIAIESKTPKWERAKSLSETRLKNEEEDYVILYKEIKLSSMRLSGESSQLPVQAMQIKAVMSETSVRITYKRCISTSEVMWTRFVLILGDMVCILTQSQLRAASLLVQSMIRTGLDSYHKEKKRKQEELRNQSKKIIYSENPKSKPQSSDKKLKKTSPPSAKKQNMRLVVNANTPKETVLALREKHKTEKLEEKLREYQDGHRSLPTFEVVQSSFHVRSGRVDIQFCDDVTASKESGNVNSSLLVMLEKFSFDLYLDQKAFSGRSHWTGANRILKEQQRWARELRDSLMEQQQQRTLSSQPKPTIHLDKLHEIGVKCSWQQFRIESVSTTTARNVSLPLVRSDKATFNIPDDKEYPAVQVNVTIYHYPDVFGNTYLTPRPNVYVYCCPLHVNVEQKTLIWMAEFLRTVLGTIDTTLATSVKDDLVSYLDAQKLKAPKETETPMIPGADVKLHILFSKVTIPLNPTTIMDSHKVNLDDGRPKALQVETSEITIVSSPIGSLANDAAFNSVLNSIKTSWLFSNANADSFPHQANTDGNILPSFMEELLSSGFKGVVVYPGDTPTCEEACFMAWHLACRCICVSFVHEMSESGITRNTTPFVPDFPVDLWLFENLTNNQAKSLTPPDQEYKPKLHAVIDVSAAVDVTVNHLELLFLMRLGDSLNTFQVTMENIFTFNKENDTDQKSKVDNFDLPLKRRPSESQIRARKSGRIANVSFELSSCVVVKAVHFNATLPVKVKQEENQKVEDEEAVTPVAKKCPILLKTPTESATESDINYNLPQGESYDNNTQELSVNVPNVTSPITLEADPSLHYAIKHSLSSTPRVITPKSRSPSGGSPTSSSPTISHSASLSSMNIDEMASQLGGYQDDDDFFVIEKVPVVQQSSTTQSSSTFTSQEGFEKAAESAGETSLKCLNGEENTSIKYLPPSTGESPQPAETEHKQEQPVDDSADDSADEVCLLSGHIPEEQSSHEGDTATNNTFIEPQTSVDGSPASNTTTSNAHIVFSDKEDTISAASHKASDTETTPSQWQLQVSISNIYATPVINPTGLTAKVSASKVSLKEIPLSVAGDTQGQENTKPNEAEDNGTYDYQPSIKARIELGPRIYNYYPSLEEINIPCVVQLHVSGVDAGLLLPLMDNLTMMFEDELKSSISVPLYIILEGNHFLIMQTPEGHAEDFSSLNVSVGSVCIQRGPEVPKLALWNMQQPSREVSSSSYTCQEPTIPTASTDLSTESDEELRGLLSSINSFTTSIQPQLQRLGNLPQAQRIDQSLGELQRTVEMIGGHYEPPPRYSESVDYEDMSKAISALQKKITSLKQEQQLLEDEVKYSQEQLQAKDTEISQMVNELVKSKDSEVAMKQVLFQLNRQIQDVVMENDQYKAALSRAGIQIRRH